MKRFGVPLAWAGLAPLSYQSWIFVTEGTWVPCTLGDVLRLLDFGFVSLQAFHRVIGYVLNVEFGLLLLLAGLFCMASGPIGSAWNAYQIRRMIEEERRIQQMRRAVPPPFLAKSA